MPSDHLSSIRVPPQGSGSLRVMILGDAPVAQDQEALQPFSPRGPAGSVLERAIRRAGLSREQFILTNTVPFMPLSGYLEYSSYEHEAIASTRPILEETIAKYQPKVILALGGVATRTITGMAGDKQGVANLTGFLLPSLYEGITCVPCFAPAYLRRGAMSHMGILLRAIKVAIAAARDGRPAIMPPVESPPADYTLYPTEEVANAFAKSAEEADNIAYDIETQYSVAEDSAEEADGQQVIESIQFSIRRNQGIFLPWREPFMDTARRVLRNGRPKLGWNNWRFDDPILRAHGCQIGGDNHDLMWAWHHLQPDLPRGLQFAAAQNGWPWPWKHLSKAHEAFYGVVDVDVLQFLVARR